MDGTSVGVLLADHDARLADVRATDRCTAAAIAGLGVEPGVRLGEEDTGTNAVGTPVEVRLGVVVHGDEHFNNGLKGFSCYGRPIIDPVTRRLQGVLDVSRVGDEHPLFVPLVRRVVRDIEERLYAESRGQQRLAAAFQRAARHKRRAVVAIGGDLVLATPAALDVLGPQ